uniref:Uncharacterized protein n=1 Tax=Vespula pensylvanica TaxID=30213 RepID=A0A834KAF9_VESPE|nr:hypothetical protein H0235_015497 [Vespula pensylvanica]
MDESGIDMGFDLAALTDINTNDQHGFGDDDFEQALSLLSTTTKDFMYYELKSRAPDTGRFSQGFPIPQLRLANNSLEALTPGMSFIFAEGIKRDDVVPWLNRCNDDDDDDNNNNNNNNNDDNKNNNSNDII